MANYSRMSRAALERTCAKHNIRFTRPLHAIPVARLRELVKQFFKTRLERELAKRLRILSIVPEAPIRNYKFDPNSRLEIDFAWPKYKIGIEVQGGLFLGTKGGHSSAAGIKRDMYKQCVAQTLGWILLPFPREYCLDTKPWEEFGVPFIIQAFTSRGFL